jgi:hypothetical protein
MTKYRCPHSDNGTFTVKAKATRVAPIKSFQVLCKFPTECGHMTDPLPVDLTRPMIS